MESKKVTVLDNVVIIRALLTLLLILYHSFAIYSGAWQSPFDNTYIPFYWWIDKFAYSFLLEGFVLLSGYVFAFSYHKIAHNKFSFPNLVKKKIHRLLLPSIIFSTFYYFIFLYDNQTSTFIKEIYGIINGCGHLWFLPMLFWCFIIIIPFIRINIGHKWKILGLFIISIVGFGPLSNFIPFRLSLTGYYFFFFYLGFLLWQKKSMLVKYSTPKNIFILLILFTGLFITLTIFRSQTITYENDLLSIKVIKVILKRVSKIIIACDGILLVFLSTNYFLSKKDLPSIITKISNYSLGIYIYHQFLIKLFYYKTILPNITGAYFSPFLIFVTALVLSYILTKYTYKTFLGKYIL